MPKASPSKAPLPKIPTKPRETKDAALYAQRQAEYQRLLAVYKEEKAAYDAGQKRREADKAAAKRHAAKAAAGDAQAPKRAKPEPSSAQSPAVEPEARTDRAPSPTVGPTAAAVQAKEPTARHWTLPFDRCTLPPAQEPTARQLAVAVVPNDPWPSYNQRRARPWSDVLGSNGERVHPTAAVRQHPAFVALDPAREAKQNAWSEAVALYAEQAGFLTAPLLYGGGEWCAEGEPDYDLEYLPSHREAQLSRLRGHGRPPTAAELAHLRWPHSSWWDDRDRIVLLHECILHFPPDGSYQWERELLVRVCCLWSDGREGSVIDKPFKGRMHWLEFEGDLAPGWRMLSSLTSCPNPHMRFPMSRDLLRRVADRDSTKAIVVRMPYTVRTAGLQGGLYSQPYIADRITLDVKPSDSVESVKAKINAEVVAKAKEVPYFQREEDYSFEDYVPSAQQRLLFEGEQLEDGFILADYVSTWQIEPTLEMKED